jgi:HAD superfamily hydrolase (TIGR01509 family)
VKQKFNSIIFDCDGVLVDSEIIANRIEVEVKTKLGFTITLEEQIRTFTGLAKSHPVMQAELKRLPANYWEVVDDRYKIAYRNELKAIKGVPETLERLRLPKCVASSSEPEWLAFKLSHTKISHHFGDSVFSTKLVKRSKPAPDLFLFVLEKMGWESSSTVVVEDSVIGVEAAKAAGLQVWGFTGGSHIYPGHEERLLKAGADRIIARFERLLEMV